MRNAQVTTREKAVRFCRRPPPRLQEPTQEIFRCARLVSAKALAPGWSHSTPPRTFDEHRRFLLPAAMPPRRQAGCTHRLSTAGAGGSGSNAFSRDRFTPGWSTPSAQRCASAARASAKLASGMGSGLNPMRSDDPGKPGLLAPRSSDVQPWPRSSSQGRNFPSNPSPCHPRRKARICIVRSLGWEPRL